MKSMIKMKVLFLFSLLLFGSNISTGFTNSSETKYKFIWKITRIRKQNNAVISRSYFDESIFEFVYYNSTTETARYIQISANRYRIYTRNYNDTVIEKYYSGIIGLFFVPPSKFERLYSIWMNTSMKYMWRWTPENITYQSRTASNYSFNGLCAGYSNVIVDYKIAENGTIIGVSDKCIIINELHIHYDTEGILLEKEYIINVTQSTPNNFLCYSDYYYEVFRRVETFSTEASVNIGNKSPLSVWLIMSALVFLGIFPLFQKRMKKFCSSKLH